VEKRIQSLLRTGTGINKTAAALSVEIATVQRIRAEMDPFESSARVKAKAASLTQAKTAQEQFCPVDPFRISS
jgi:hypothetical protein